MKSVKNIRHYLSTKYDAISGSSSAFSCMNSFSYGGYEFRSTAFQPERVEDKRARSVSHFRFLHLRRQILTTKIAPLPD